MSPSNRVSQLYPQTLDSLFVASYDSQGYGGGIRTRLHMALLSGNGSWSSLYSLATDSTENTVSNNSSTDACVSVEVITWRLFSHGLEMGVFTEPFPKDGCFFWLHSSCFEQICNNRHSRSYVVSTEEALKTDGEFATFSVRILYSEGARGSVVGWGTMLQAGRSPVREPDEVDFFNLPNPSSRTMALGSTLPLTEMSTRNLPGDKNRPEPRADNLAAIYERNVWKCGSLNFSCKETVVG
jgi:hypothetical protein